MFRPCPRPRPKLLDKRAIAAAKLAEWRRLTKFVRQRDGGKCRICGKPGFEVHHVVYRSRGGKDEARNLILTCKTCHQDIHGHVLFLRGVDAKGRVQWERVA